MGHNSVVSGYPKSTGIPRVNGLSTGPSGFGASHMLSNRIMRKGGRNNMTHFPH